MDKQEKIKFLEDTIESIMEFRKNYLEEGVADFLLGHSVGFLQSLRLIEQDGNPALSEEAYATAGMRIFGLADNRNETQD